MNDDNLVSFSDYTASIQREIASKGGVASGVAKRKKRTMRSIASMIANADVTNDKIKSHCRELGIDDEFLTNGAAIVARLAAKAMNGDSRATHEFLDLLGEVNNQHIKTDCSVTVTLSASDAMQKLYRPFSETYQNFFYACRSDRHVLLQGGRRSGKTQATLRHLLRLGEVMNDGSKVLVCCSSFPMLSKTIEDFKSIIPTIEIHNQECETAGLRWQFASFDEYTKAQGSQCDYLFINEAVNMNEDIADVLSLGTRRQCFYNYNPTKASWVTKHIADDEHNLIKTTFRDNAYLPEEQVAEFEKMRERALLPTATLHDRYVYEVYYNGNFAKLAGQVFGNLERCTLRDYEQVQATECFGLDFGFATDGDPTVLVGVKVSGACIYVREYIYQQGLTSDAELITRMLECGISERTPINADYGGNGRQRIVNCRGGAGVTKAMNIINAIKPKILDNLGRMLTFDKIFVVESSTSTLKEFESYELDSNNKPKGADHAIDAARYAFNYAERL